MSSFTSQQIKLLEEFKESLRKKKIREAASQAQISSLFKSAPLEDIIPEVVEKVEKEISPKRKKREETLGNILYVLEGIDKKISILKELGLPKDPKAYSDVVDKRRLEIAMMALGLEDTEVEQLTIYERRKALEYVENLLKKRSLHRSFANPLHLDSAETLGAKVEKTVRRMVKKLHWEVDGCFPNMEV